ncbi:SIS domain-containing protein [Candidatus Tisiphia endosymbiont of Neophilaenus lineatus]|uniref:KpsF/GutQ family sugar-phosphate isomerase n=1 Tax=Candidatus Tisiphia endosymbiont of Neophilaenus lineatus TaxID=3139336 RepID=UPI0035CBF6E9
MKIPYHCDVAKRVILQESAALVELSNNIPSNFNNIVDYIINYKGRVILTGIGKSGYIAHKIAASFASTGTAAFYLHPAEASHGDLGMVTDNDVVFMLSNSGETRELFDIMKYCKRFSIKIIAMTMNANSTIAINSDFLLLIPRINEASYIAAPTTSSVMMLSLGDALTTSVHEARGFSEDDFRLYHPGGKIGANLIKVESLMRVKDQLPLVYVDTSFTDTILVMNQKSLGCAIVVDKDLSLVGIITDGDLRRHINDKIDMKYACDVMTSNPKQISPLKLAGEALGIMNSKSITSIPVTENNMVIGIVHIHDLLRAGIS